MFEKQKSQATVNPRTQRVGDLLQRELARILLSEVRDPRIRDVTVTMVQVAKDLSFARVFVTCMDHDPKELCGALNKASSFIRSKLLDRLHMRSIPTLRFTYDAAVVRGNQLLSLIEKTIAMENSQNH